MFEGSFSLFISEDEALTALSFVCLHKTVCHLSIFNASRKGTEYCNMKTVFFEHEK